MNTNLFGQFLLEEGLTDAEQLYEALRYQQDNNKVLGELARDEGILSEEQVQGILEWQLCEDRDFGAAALEMGLLGQEELDNLLQLQSERHVYLGDALVALGVLDGKQIISYLERFDSIREQPETQSSQHDEAEAGDIPMTIWSIFSRVLPRYTSGEVLSGGFYPTIKSPEFGKSYLQRVTGDVELKLAILIDDELDKLISGMGVGKSSAALLTSVLEVFCSVMEESGVAVAPAGKAKPVSLKTISKQRSSSPGLTCAEFVLIQPPLPDGDFHQINCCLLLGKGCDRKD